MSRSGLFVVLLLALIASNNASPSDRIIPEDPQELLVDPDAHPADASPESSKIKNHQLREVAKKLKTLGLEPTTKHKLQDSLAVLSTSTTRAIDDGGTKALIDSVANGKVNMHQAIQTVKDGLEGDFRTGSGDLDTLASDVDTAIKTIPEATLEGIKGRASDWCDAKEDLDARTTAYDTAAAAVANFDPVLPTAEAFFSKLVPVTDCNSETTLVGGQCPDPALSLATISSGLQAGIRQARLAYHTLDATMDTSLQAKTSSIQTNIEKNTTYTTGISDTVQLHRDMCAVNFGVYQSSITTFNGHNAHRAQVYRTLEEISCAATNLGDSAAEQTCVSGLNSISQIQSTKFADKVAETLTCPADSVYLDQISGYRTLSLSVSWQPSTIVCPAVKIPTTNGPTAAPTPRHHHQEEIQMITALPL